MITQHHQPQTQIPEALPYNVAWVPTPITQPTAPPATPPTPAPGNPSGSNLIFAMLGVGAVAVIAGVGLHDAATNWQAQKIRGLQGDLAEIEGAKAIADTTINRLESDLAEIEAEQQRQNARIREFCGGR